MRDFNTSIIIDQSLRDFLKNLEELFSIEIDDNVIARIFHDSENDQVSEKSYSIYSSRTRIFSPSLTILANVEEYEPETLIIQIMNIKSKDYQKLQSLI